MNGRNGERFAHGGDRLILQTLLLTAALTVGQTSSPPKAVLLAPVAHEETSTTQPEAKVPPAKPAETSDSAPYHVYEAGGHPGFLYRLLKAYCDDRKKMREHANGNGNGNDKDNGNGQGEENGKNEEPPRRAMPSPFESPPFQPPNIKAFR
jgi:hypothetical protein